MNRYSTRQAAKKLGIAPNTLSQYIAQGKLPQPQGIIAGIRPTHVWTEQEIENVREILPKIANGRKTRYKKKHSALSNQRSAKKKHSAVSTQQSRKAKVQTKKKR
jgi:predicted transcriptional regulator